MEEIDKAILLKEHPYISLITYGGNEYIGIIQNVDDTITTIYDYGVLTTEPQKLLYLELAQAWWWESNRLIPINVFLKHEWIVFRPTLKTLNSKNVEIKCGPHISLKDIASRRGKRRSITLIKKIT